MSVSQIQVRAGAAEDYAGLAISGQGRAATGGRARARVARWQLCPSSFALAGVTVILVWTGVMDLLRQGRLEAVLRAGWAELAAPVLVALVVAAGVCERVWPAEPVTQPQLSATAPLRASAEGIPAKPRQEQRRGCCPGVTGRL